LTKAKKNNTGLDLQKQRKTVSDWIDKSKEKQQRIGLTKAWKNKDSLCC